jgi:hypothetical protein
MLRRSDGSWAEDEKRLQCRKGDQKSDERVLDRPPALPVLFQAADVSKGQRLTTDGVRLAQRSGFGPLANALTAFKAKRIAGAMDWGYPGDGSIRSIADRQTSSAASIERP